MLGQGPAVKSGMAVSAYYYDVEGPNILGVNRYTGRYSQRGLNPYLMSG